MPIALTATLATAAACALINIWLAIRVAQVRRSERVSIGDGGNLRVIARMRAHANFIEYAPIVLILLALVELANGTSAWVWACGAAFVAGRIAHGVGMDMWKPGRGIGIALTLLVTLALAVTAALAALDTRARPNGARIEAVPPAG